MIYGKYMDLNKVYRAIFFKKITLNVAICK